MTTKIIDYKKKKKERKKTKRSRARAPIRQRFDFFPKISVETAAAAALRFRSLRHQISSRFRSDNETRLVFVYKVMFRTDSRRVKGRKRVFAADFQCSETVASMCLQFMQIKQRYGDKFQTRGTSWFTSEVE